MHVSTATSVALEVQKYVHSTTTQCIERPISKLVPAHEPRYVAEQLKTMGCRLTSFPML